MKTPTSDYTHRIAFRNIPVNCFFACNGTLFRKCSTRTAKLQWPSGPERSFYFSNNDPCFTQNQDATK